MQTQRPGRNQPSLGVGQTREEVRAQSQVEVHVQSQEGVHAQSQEGVHVQSQEGVHVQSQEGVHGQSQEEVHAQSQEGVHAQSQEGIQTHNPSTRCFHLSLRCLISLTLRRRWRWRWARRIPSGGVPVPVPVPVPCPCLPCLGLLAGAHAGGRRNPSARAALRAHHPCLFVSGCGCPLGHPGSLWAQTRSGPASLLRVSALLLLPSLPGLLPGSGCRFGRRAPGAGGRPRTPPARESPPRSGRARGRQSSGGADPLCGRF